MRRSIILAAVLTASFALTACSGSTTPAGDATTTAKAAGGGTLTIWVDETRQAAVKSAATAYEAETGNTVTLVQKNFDDIRPDFLAQVPTGKGPDITVGAHDWLGEMIKNGVVAPVELGAKAKEFEPVALEAFSYEGQVYGLPYAIENVAMIRNTALADSTPATWDDMVAKGKAAGTKYPVLVQVGEKGDGYTMYPLQTSFGAPVFTQAADGTYSSKLALGGEPGSKFASFLAAQGAAGIFDVSMTYDIAVEAFKNGESPYIIGGPWMLDTFKDLKLAIDPVPSAGGEKAQPFTGVAGFFVNAQSKNQLLANDFLTNYMSTEKAQLALYDAGHRTPALIAAADSLASDPIAAGFRAVGADAVPMPSIPEMGSVWTFWGATEAGIISGASEPVASWTKMSTDIQAAIDAS